MEDAKSKEDKTGKRYGAIKRPRRKKRCLEPLSELDDSNSSTTEEPEAPRLKQSARPKINRMNLRSKEEKQSCKVSGNAPKQSSHKKKKQKILDDPLDQEDLKAGKQTNQNQKQKRIKVTEEENRKKRTETCRAKRKADEATIRKAIELELLATRQNRELTEDEKEVLKLAEQIKAKKLRASELYKISIKKRSPEELAAYKLKSLEAQKISRRIKREKQNEIITKAKELFAIKQNRELSSDEKELLKLAEETKAEILRKRELKKTNRKNHEKVLTPEQKDAIKLKRREREKQIRAAKHEDPIPDEDDQSLEYYKDVALKRRETEKRARTRRRETAKLTLQKANQLLTTTSQNREMSSDEKEVLKLAEEIKAKRLRITERRRRYRLRRAAETTPEEKKSKKIKQKEAKNESGENLSPKGKALKEKRINHTKEPLMRENDAASKEREDKIKQKEATNRSGENLSPKGKALKEKRINHTKEPLMRENDAASKEHLQKRCALEIQDSGCLRKDQILDDIKIEQEDLTETTIQAVPNQLNANSFLDVQQEVFNDSSCSWITFSENSFVSKTTTNNHSNIPSFHGGSSGIQKSFSQRNSQVNSTQLHGRKLSLEKSFRCMRVVINATAKPDVHAVFGRQIAQKLRTSKKDVAEVKIAKKLIDDILQNLTTGLYNSEPITII